MHGSVAFAHEEPAAEALQGRCGGVSPAFLGVLPRQFLRQRLLALHHRSQLCASLLRLFASQHGPRLAAAPLCLDLHGGLFTPPQVAARGRATCSSLHCRCRVVLGTQAGAECDGGLNFHGVGGHAELYRGVDLLLQCRRVVTAGFGGGCRGVDEPSCTARDGGLQVCDELLRLHDRLGVLRNAVQRDCPRDALSERWYLHKHQMPAGASQPPTNGKEGHPRATGDGQWR